VTVQLREPRRCRPSTEEEFQTFAQLTVLICMRLRDRMQAGYKPFTLVVVDIMK